MHLLRTSKMALLSPGDEDWSSDRPGVQEQRKVNEIPSTRRALAAILEDVSAVIYRGQSRLRR